MNAEQELLLLQNQEAILHALRGLLLGSHNRNLASTITVQLLATEQRRKVLEEHQKQKAKTRTRLAAEQGWSMRI